MSQQEKPWPLAGITYDQRPPTVPFREASAKVKHPKVFYAGGRKSGSGDARKVRPR